MKAIFIILVSTFLVGAYAAVGFKYNFNSTQVTFTNDVRPIFKKYCAECHFGSLSYDAAYKNRNNIYNKFVRLRQMPPKYSGVQPTELEVQLVKQWIDQGAKK